MASDNVAILGTKSSHGGTMVTASGASWQTAQGGVCCLGDSHSCPIPGHGTKPIVSGCSSTATAQGKPLAIKGAVAGCGAILTTVFASNISVV